MGVTLYTSRVVLNTLGVEDFGIFNVVGGIVIMLGFLNHAMTASTQRFLTFELGKENFHTLKKVFNVSLSIHLIIAIIIFTLAETLGLWLLNAYLTIPADRVLAANWVYQCSIFSFIVTITNVPYNASVIANEKMSFYAWIGISEVILKLAAVYILILFSFDKLILYAVLMLLITIICSVAYRIYCITQLNMCKKGKLEWDRSLFTKMSGFAGWNLLGVGAGIGYNQGVNILLNIFTGPVVNAARGIAFQIQGAVMNFTTNFQTAVNPSITKLYARDERGESFSLVFSASKFSFFLLLLLSIPLFLKTELILHWWLKNVPDYAAPFTRLILIDVLINSVSGPLQTLAQASGNIRKYQVIVSGILLLNLPTSFFFLYYGFDPTVTIYVSIIYSCVALICRLSILKEIMSFPALSFFLNVVCRIAMVSLLTFLILFTSLSSLTYVRNNFFLITPFSLSIAFSLIISLGLNHRERKTIYNYSVTALKKLIR